MKERYPLYFHKDHTVTGEGFVVHLDATLRVLLYYDEESESWVADCVDAGLCSTGRTRAEALSWFEVSFLEGVDSIVLDSRSSDVKGSLGSFFYEIEGGAEDWNEARKALRSNKRIEELAAGAGVAGVERRRLAVGAEIEVVERLKPRPVEHSRLFAVAA